MGYVSTEKFLKPDPKFGSKTLAKFINCLMQDGEKAVSQRIVYEALAEIEKRTKGKPSAMEVFDEAINNVKPHVEVRSKRVGGANYQVPMQVNRRRQISLAFRWIIDSAREEKGKPMYLRLAKELSEASKGEGKAMSIRDQTHRMADANKAFAHFAW
jgi:small subunit ribosomal protein S7